MERDRHGNAQSEQQRQFEQDLFEHDHGGTRGGRQQKASSLVSARDRLIRAGIAGYKPPTDPAEGLTHANVILRATFCRGNNRARIDCARTHRPSNLILLTFTMSSRLFALAGTARFAATASAQLVAKHNNVLVG
jgi:hypothetical protein